jgi:hypothetical protein
MSYEKILLALLLQAAGEISESLRTSIRQSILELEKKAQATPNPWDNILVILLKTLLFVKEDK